MSVSKETIDSIAELACLSFTDAEKEDFFHQFGKVLGYIETIRSVDLPDVKPLANVVDNENVFREDTVQPSLSTEEALANAPKHNNVFFKVPKVLE